MLRIVTAFFICAFGLYLGFERQKRLKDDVVIIEEYITLIAQIESSARFMNKNLYQTLESSNKCKKFCDFLIENRDDGIRKSISTYTCENKFEKECIKIICDEIVCLEECSDVKRISNALKYAAEKLEIYKNTVSKEFNGKIKTTPVIYGFAGIFIAILLL